MENLAVLTQKLPFERWVIDIEPEQRIQLQDDAGNILHGGFGRALAAVSEGLYQQVFNRHSPQAPKSFTVSPVQPEQQSIEPTTGFQFALTLFDVAQPMQLQVLMALLQWQQLGFGGDRVRFKIRCITNAQGDLLFAPGINSPLPAAGTIADVISSPPSQSPANVLVKSDTRIHFKINKKVSDTAPAAHDFKRLIQHRYAQLYPQWSEFLKPEFEDIGRLKEKAVIMHDNARFVQWQRYSKKEQRQVKFGGLLGYWVYQGLSDIDLLWLQLGQLTGIGNKTSFGFGQYKVFTG